MCESCRKVCKGIDIEIDDARDDDIDDKITYENVAYDKVTDDYSEDIQFELFVADVDCESCPHECDNIENMKANGYIDATEFIQCEMVSDSKKDDSRFQLYVGPMCSADGSMITIGIFTDEYCTKPDFGKDVENYIRDENGFSLKLSRVLLEKTYDRECFECGGVYNGFGMCKELGQAGTIWDNDEGTTEARTDNEVVDSNSGYGHTERYSFGCTLFLLGTAALLLTH